jgi:signal transduction histidine kinase
MTSFQNERSAAFASFAKSRDSRCAARRLVEYLHGRRMRAWRKMARQWQFVLVAFLAAAGTGWGQQPASNWRVYKVADGMSEPACSSITIGPRGKVWVTHTNANSMSGLDGYTVQNMATPHGGRSRVYESPNGQLWAACEDGLREFRDTNWTLYPVPGIAAEFRTGQAQTPAPVPLYPFRLGRVIFLLPGGLFEFNATEQGARQVSLLRSNTQTRLEKFLGMTAAAQGGLWISGARGLARVRERDETRTVTTEAVWQEFIPPESLNIQNFQQPVEDADGNLVTVAESLETGQTVAVRFDGDEWTVYHAGRENIRQAWCGPDKTMWAVTADSLFQSQPGHEEMLPNEEIAPRRYFDVAVEPGGTFWLATSDGLYRHSPAAWRTDPPLGKPDSPILGIAEGEDDRLWVAAEGSLNVLQNNHWKTYPTPEDTTRNFPGAGRLFVLNNGTIVFGAGNRLAQFDPKSERFNFVSQRQMARVQPVGLLKEGTLCVQSFSLEPGRESRRLEVFDGSAFSPFPYAQPDLNLGNGLFLFASPGGNLWLGGDKGIARLNDGKWQLFGPANGPVAEGITSMVEINEDRIWCGAQNKIWECDGKTWRIILGGVDRVTALLRARDGSIWAAAENGLRRYYRGAWVANGVREGLPGEAVREIHEDRRGRIWAGTSRGLSLYHPDADPDPPETSVDNLGPMNTVPEGSTVNLSFNGRDKWKYTPADRLLYSYRLDGEEWSPNQTEKSASFPDLAAGKHYFQVRSMDRNWNVDPQTALLVFTAAVPWYRESRLLLIASAGLAITLFFAALAVNRHRRLVRSYAEVEAKVALRTKQLEAAHRQLLHSQKMNALGTLAAGIAHDFNNILSIIKGSAQIIEDNLENPAKIRTRTDRIGTVVEQGAGIVKAMLGFSRGSGPQFTMCHVNTVVEETSKLLGDRFVREVEVKFNPAPSLPEVPASKDFIQQILLNLIFNAAEAMTERRRVILTTGRFSSRLPPGVVLAPADAPAHVFISVKDFGGGIAPEIMPRIFEPFFTTKSLSARRGTGLGLSMVYELARQMDAGLAVESVVGGGSVFTLILPVRDLPVDTPALKS